MKIIIASSEEIAKSASRQYVELLKEKPNAVLGFATGSTPLPLYAELVSLCKEGKLSFKDVTTFNLDEYVGLEPTHDQSYRYFMNTNLFDLVDVDKSRTHVPSGIDTSDEALAQYDKDIALAGRLDMQLLGIGCNGHIGFNEPGTPLESLTHVVELTQNTREVNSRLFNDIGEVPTHAATMGIKTVMNARKIILIATGASKAQAMFDTIKGPVSSACPASVLQLHPDVTVYMDKDAAALL